MDIGGVEKALLGVLSVIPYDKYDVTVGLLHRRGGFLEYLPSCVKIIDVNCYDKYREIINDPPLQYIKNFLLMGRVKDAFIYFCLYMQRKINRNHYWLYKYFMRHEPMLSDEIYDMAVAFAGPSQMMDYYICKRVKAWHKCCWIHFDVSKFGIDVGMTRKLYKNYDKIFIVSQTAKDIFNRMFPSLANRTEVFHNIVNPVNVREMAEQGETFDDNFVGKRILTVGRISEEKGCREALECLRILLDRGINVKWYFIGDGSDRQLLYSLMLRQGLENNVCFLGPKTNPYGYMRECDIYVQPSRHEGFCIALEEALCFENPIVATDFTGAKEQLRHRKNGVVVGMSPKDICDGIILVLSKGKVSGKTVSNNDIDKFLQLLK